MILVSNTPFEDISLGDPEDFLPHPVNLVLSVYRDLLND